MEEEGQRRLDLQKQEYEATVQRQRFIDLVRENCVARCLSVEEIQLLPNVYPEAQREG